eukprot:TRINITY_DN20167_c0_g1_i1.p2 TRINITY_DN20167_c0_g1~~TRINITY_DN20167_c0_g1_i1.p2  ORF type:complete len:118 (+),score=31.07 TRINITY_DN20167_c0_g1_i1:36-389(+)
MSSHMLVLLVVLVVGMAAAGDRDELCWDTESGVAVKTSNCTFGCCIDGDCGSEGQCDKAHDAAVVASAVAVGCCCGLAVMAFMYWKKIACFKSVEPPTPSPFATEFHQAPTVIYTQS